MEAMDNAVARQIWDEQAGKYVRRYFDEHGLRIHPSDIRGIELVAANGNVCGCDLWFAPCPQ